MLTAAQLITLASAVIALRGNASHDEPRHQPMLRSAAPLVVYATAILAAALILVAAVRHRRTAPRPTTKASPGGRRQWWPAGWAVLALAGVVLGVVVLLTVVPHRAADPPPLTAPQSTEPSPPDTPVSTPAPPPEPSASPTADLLPASVVVLPVLLGLLAAGALIARRRAATENTPPTAATHPAEDPLTRATELGLRAVSTQELEPREAIVACYAAMEQALAESPDVAPHASDTPSEVLARAVEHGALQQESAVALVELFAEARFSRHAITEAQRQAATAALRRVLGELRSQPCVPSP